MMMSGRNIMKKYIVTVNGKKYEVEVEEVGNVETSQQSTPKAAANAEAEKKAVESRETQASRPVEGKSAIKAPMPGTILDVRISKGQTIKKGDVLFILEAMKMENEIMSGEDGTVVDIAVSKGTAVNTDDVLATIG